MAMANCRRPYPLVVAQAELNKRDGFELTEVDVEIRKKHWSQLTGLFLIERTGIIRWTHVEAGTCHHRLWAIPGQQRHPGRQAPQARTPQPR